MKKNIAWVFKQTTAKIFNSSREIFPTPKNEFSVEIPLTPTPSYLAIP